MFGGNGGMADFCGEAEIETDADARGRRTMNDAELRARLRAIQPEARSNDYWEEFPNRVMSQLPRQRMDAPVKEPWFPAMAWGAGLAMACVTIGFFIGKADPALANRMAKMKQSLKEGVRAEALAVCDKMQSETRNAFVSGSP